MDVGGASAEAERLRALAREHKKKQHWHRRKARDLMQAAALIDAGFRVQPDLASKEA